jgi:hypothetical protein
MHSSSWLGQRMLTSIAVYYYPVSLIFATKTSYILMLVLSFKIITKMKPEFSKYNL